MQLKEIDRLSLETPQAALDTLAQALGTGVDRPAIGTTSG
jgi:hypothetical protein